MDELGSALRHSDVANFRIAPFLFMPEGNLTSAVRCSFSSIPWFSCCVLANLIVSYVLFFCFYTSFYDQALFWLVLHTTH